MPVTSCAVFCGSRDGADPAYIETARAMGEALARQRITLVYGGGHTGLMGHVADSALAHQGIVKGVIPEFLQAREVMHEGVEDLVITSDMASRKALLFDWADAYVILPGGFGTFDEFFEVLVNRQIGLHHKPIILLNVASWADPAIALLEACISQGLADRDAASLYEIVETVDEVITLLQA